MQKLKNPKDFVLLSVNPIFMKLIFSQEKNVEFRRVLPKHIPKKIFFYETYPTKKIVGFAEGVSYITKNVEELWGLTHFRSGVTRQEFYSYFQGKENGNCILIDNIKGFIRPIDPKKIDENFVIPQSFRYLSLEEIKKIEFINNEAF